MDTTKINIPLPSIEQVEYYIDKWNKLENYHLQESALNKLFFDLCPSNSDITNILIKASTLNDFYSTNIFSIYPVCHHIHTLQIDKRLNEGDITLVKDLQFVSINGKVKNFYSFATKYCSHHKPLDFPIYDSYVASVLQHFRDSDGFSKFQNLSLKNYETFKSIIIQFRKFYNLENYNLKQIDQYLWQLGKEYFPKKYK